jgi:replicative superfamily II helicase
VKGLARDAVNGTVESIVQGYMRKKGEVKGEARGPVE